MKKTKEVVTTIRPIPKDPAQLNPEHYKKAISGELVQKEYKVPKPLQDVIDADPSLAKISKEKDGFMPSKKMIKWVETEMALMEDSPLKVAEASGINRSSWYQWNRKPEFREWYLSVWNDRVKMIGPELDKIGFKQAKRGKYKFWEAMQKRTGNLADTSQQGTVANIQMNVDFISHD